MDLFFLAANLESDEMTSQTRPGCQVQFQNGSQRGRMIKSVGRTVTIAKCHSK